MHTSGQRSCGGIVRNALCAGLCLALYAAYPQARAQGQTYAPAESVHQYTVPAGPLSAALNAWGAQSDRQLVFAPELAVGKQSLGVSGRYSADEALARVLNGTGLTPERVDGQTYTLKRGFSAIPTGFEPQSVTAPDSASDALPPVENAETKNLTAVVVSASRITSRPDLSLGTPQIPVSSEDLKLDLSPNVGLAINNLPQFTPSRTPANTSNQSDNSGQTTLDLRGLGSARTLVLLDGKRFVGSVDTKSVPSILIKGVQVVTGGASATWGSDAVSGVVNLILDDNFSGFDGKLQSGISTYGDAQQQQVAFKIGKEINNGVGHFVIGAEYGASYGIGTMIGSRDAVGTNLTLPISGGKYQIFSRVGNINQAIGGVITTGALAGNVFNPDGTLRPFDYGSYRAGSSSVGGDSYSWQYPSEIIAPVKDYSILSSVKYNISDNIKATAQAQFSKAYTNNPLLSDFAAGNIVINADNAFLRPDLKQRLEAAGETSFKMGRANTDLNRLTLQTNRRAAQYTVGLSGTFPSTYWHWDTYLSHGVLTYDKTLSGLRLKREFAFAVDSISDPVTGQPICRIALTDPSTDCLPLDLFGHGAPSLAAARYATAAAHRSETDTQDVFSASIDGSPFSLPAGEVSVAGGVDWRRQSTRATVGPHDTRNDLILTHFTPLSGAYQVKEGFGEIYLPLLANVAGFRDFSTDIAARYSDYTGSGSIWSYKIGLNDEVIDGLRLRGGWSRDIRAANAIERFTDSGILYTTIIDPATHQSAFFPQITGGNPHLRPERATTQTLGVTYAPTWLGGTNMSVDYYNIDIEDVIISPTAQSIADRCATGAAEMCTRMTRDATGQITGMNTSYVNLANYKTDGVDLDFQYQKDAQWFGISGIVRLRMLSTWVHKLTTSDGIQTIEYAGSLTGLGGPRWRSTASLTFDTPKGSAYGRVRYFGPTLRNRALPIVNNDIPSYFYFDTGFDVGIAAQGKLRLSFNVLNIFNKMATIVTGTSSYYDVVGRYYSAGLEYKLP